MKGFFSKNLELFIGLVIVIFILLITFKLLGMWAAFQYEHEAEKSAKNLQTAMNYVCASPKGVTQVVKINLPQKISPTGSSNPLDFIRGLITRDVEAVSNALRYMTALKSYGDPWYVIYYERFPQGEDSGWTGWSEIAAMRTTSIVFRGIDAVSCAIEIIPFSRSASRLYDLVKIVEGKKVKKMTELYGETSKLRRGVSITVSTLKKIKQVPDSVGEKLFLKNIYSKIADKVKVPANRIWGWIRGKTHQELADHFSEVPKVRIVSKSMPDIVEKLKKGPNLRNEVGGQLDNLNRKADEVLRGDPTNKEVREFMKNLKDSRLDDLGIDSTKFYDGVAKDMEDLKNLVSRYEINLAEDEIRILNKLADDIKEGKIPELKQIELARKKLPTEMEAVISPYLDEMEGYVSLHRIGDNINPERLIDDTSPWRWSREIYRANLEEKITGLPALTKIGIRKRVGPVTTKWGVWRGSSFIFSEALSLAEVSMLKFSPCSSNSLCLKSQVSPSITIYPLEECEQAGIDYIELEKYPYKTVEKDEREEGFFGLNRRIDEQFGASTYSRFYSASPCGGKLKIERAECECSGIKKPYIDHENRNRFHFECIIDENKDIVCDMRKYIPYLDLEEIESISVSSQINTIEDRDGEIVMYRVEIDFTEEIKEDEAYSEFKNCASKDHEIFFDNLSLSCGVYVSSDLPEEFECEFEIPAVPFCTTECGGSNLWLECVNWTNVGNMEKELPGLEEKEKVEVTEWCCLQWNLTAYGGVASGTSREIIKVSGCEDYTEPKWSYLPDNTKEKIDKNIKNVLTETSGGKNIWGISSPVSYANSVKKGMLNAIKDTSRIELEEGRDPNSPSINSLFMLNLESHEKIDCLRVTFIAEDTRGFCYSSPPRGEELKEIGWVAGSIVAEVATQAGITALCGLSTGGLGSIACVKGAGLAACELGNVIMWYGQGQVAEGKQKRLWPHNTFFDDYLIK